MINCNPLSNIEYRLGFKLHQLIQMLLVRRRTAMMVLWMILSPLPTLRSFLLVETYCKTPACIQAASSILNAMDPSVDPCDDFYQYACGGWERQSPIPPGYQMWDRFQELSGKNLYVLKNLIGIYNPPYTGFLFLFFIIFSCVY